MKKLTYIVIAMMICFLTGCGSSSKKDLDQKELVYGYESLACMDEIKGDIMNFDVAGEDVFIYSAEYADEKGKEEQLATHFYKCKTDGSGLTELPIKWDKVDFEWLHSMESCKQDGLWLLFSAYNEKTMTSTYILRLTDETGKVKKEIDVKEYVDVEDFYVSDMKVDATGNLYVCTGYSILCFDPKGEFTASIEKEEYIENLICTKDGEIWAVLCENEMYVLAKVEAEKKSLGEKHQTKIPFYSVTSDMDGLIFDLYYCRGESLFGYNLPTEEAPGGSTQLVHFMASDLNTGSIGKIEVVSGDTVWAMYGVDKEEGAPQLYVIRKKDPEEMKEREVVTFASLYFDAEVKEKAMQFNRSQDEYLVVLKNYDYEKDAVRAFYKDLRSGEVIDMVDLNGMASSGKFIAQDMFVDLYTFMEDDEEIKKEIFSENVLRIMETDGKLYRITPLYGINGMFTKESLALGGKPLTTDVLESLEKGGAKAFYRQTKSSLLTEMLEMNYHSYVDWSSGTSSFDSEEFIRVLEYCDTYPEEIDYFEEESMTKKVRSGEVLFAGVYSSAPEDLQIYKKMFGEEVTMTGYPSESYCGPAMSFHREFAICSSSTDKEGAWKFMKEFLSREYTAGNPNDTISVPIRKDSLEDKIKRYTATETYTDEFGNEILPISYDWGNEETLIKVKPLDKEGEALYRNILQQVDRACVYDADINDIVTQEAEYFFDGKVSAKEAAANIQKRVSVYMSDYKKEEKK